MLILLDSHILDLPGYTTIPDASAVCFDALNALCEIRGTDVTGFESSFF